MIKKLFNIWFVQYLAVVVIGFFIVFIFSEIGAMFDSPRVVEEQTKKPNPPLQQLEVLQQPTMPHDEMRFACVLALELYLSQAISFDKVAKDDYSFSKEKYLQLKFQMAKTHPRWSEKEKEQIIQYIKKLQQNVQPNEIMQHETQYKNALQSLSPVNAMMLYAGLKIELQKPEKTEETCEVIYILLHNLKPPIYKPQTKDSSFELLESLEKGKEDEYVNNYFKHYFVNENLPVPRDGFEIEALRSYVNFYIKQGEYLKAIKQYEMMLQFILKEAYIYKSYAQSIAMQYAFTLKELEITRDEFLQKLEKEYSFSDVKRLTRRQKMTMQTKDEVVRLIQSF